jgi:hypothetical protein
LNPGNNFYQLCFDLFGKVLMYFKALSLSIYFKSSCDGDPSTETILWIWSKKSYPGNKGVLPNNSAIIVPTDQISTAFEYSLALRITYGALYHLVTTYSVFSYS